MTTDIRKNRFLSIDKIFLIVFGLIFLFQAYRFITTADNFFFVDLRNRVVGARLMDKGMSPYFFKWDPSYPETLADPSALCNIRNNMVTVPPSVLLLMKPLVNLSYKNICRIWVGIHFLFFLLILIPLYFICTTPVSKICLLTVGGVLLFVDQWTASLIIGQVHFIFPAIVSSIISVSFTKWKHKYLLIGILVAVLAWLRPNGLMLLPFIFLCKEVNKKQLLAGFFSTATFLVLVTFIAGHQNYWIDFFDSCREWVKNNSEGKVYSNCITPRVIEGKTLKSKGPVPGAISSEINNLPNLFRLMVKGKTQSTHFMWLFVIAYIVALLYTLKKKTISFIGLLFMGVFLYWFSEITAPILKYSYYYVELFVLILFFAAMFEKLRIVEKILLIVSLVVIFTSFLVMNLTISEWCVIACLLSYVYNNDIKKTT